MKTTEQAPRRIKAPADFWPDREIEIGRVNFVIGYAEPAMQALAHHIAAVRPGSRFDPATDYLKTVSDFEPFGEWAAEIVCHRKYGDRFRLSRETGPVENSADWTGIAAGELKDGDWTFSEPKPVEIHAPLRTLLRVLAFLWNMRGGTAVLPNADAGLLPRTAVKIMQGVYATLAMENRGPEAAVIVTASQALMSYGCAAVRESKAGADHRRVFVHMAGTTLDDALQPSPELRTFRVSEDGKLTGGWPYGFFNYGGVD